MNNYLIMVHASWITSDEHPLGHRPNIRRTKSKSLKRTFESPNDESARLKAQEILDEFKKGLPREERTSDSYASKPKIKSQHFARILPL